MLDGIGLDLCGIERMRNMLEKGAPPERIFTPGERDYILSRGRMAADSMAGIWAAKEAFCKAVGTGIAFPLTDVEILHNEKGAPGYRLHGKAEELACGGRVLLSISHEGEMAAAVCVWERNTVQ